MKPPTLKEQGYLPSRYLVALMAFLGMVFNYMLRVNINLTIVAMVTNDNSTSPVQDVCHFKDDNDQTEDYDGEFDWDEWTQGLITGSFFWGYIWTQIPGSQAGTIIGFPLAATIIDSLGWEAVFYIQASLTLVWCAGWFLLVADTPDSDSRISKVERDYIYNSLGGSKEKKAPPVPWRSALTSLPFWAILVAGVGNNWGFYTLLTDLPLYMKQMLQKDIKSNAVLSGLPYLGMWIFSLVVSSVGDRLRQNDTLSTQTVRKTANTIAHVGPAICLLCLSLVECNRGATIALLFTAVTLQGGIYTGFMVNHVDIAPNFAGTLFGITNAAATIPGWVAPMTVGALTNNQQTFGQWRKVFFISAGIFVVDALFFLLYASGKEQEWNKVPEKSVKKDLKDAVVTGQKSPPGVNMLQEGTTDMLDSEAYSKYILNSNFRNSYQNKAFQSE
ncbi:putative inorganic phosphate cotransporter isoform X2 [Homarus americanus]|uniref:putative inorganic phosphate cotransporter isoform X2 n=1 Tax=Homarus americanus TaxID=6706 RepID=UPI001C442B7B|nr:putative inorganic phosphate cotransporter isoform X2 [Homarus americanus]